MHGIALATDLGRGFISAGKADAVKVFDLATNKVVATVVDELDPEHFAVTQTASTAKGARAIAFDAASHRLFLPTASFAPVETTPLDSQPKPPILPDSFVVLVVAQAF